jgi:hypothetical protein
VQCDNCKKTQPEVTVQVRRRRGDDGVSHFEDWCLECIQGKNPVRTGYDI